MKGRKPKPTHLHVVNGNPGKRARNKREPKPKRGVPQAPPHLSNRVLIAWTALSVQLDAMGVLSEAETWALEQLAENYIEILDLRAVIKEEGRFQSVETKNGDTRKIHHPAWTQLADAEKRFKAMMSEFGLTPSARTRVNAEKTEEDSDPAAKFFA